MSGFQLYVSEDHAEFLRSVLKSTIERAVGLIERSPSRNTRMAKLFEKNVAEELLAALSRPSPEASAVTASEPFDQPESAMQVLSEPIAVPTQAVSTKPDELPWDERGGFKVRQTK